METPLAFDRDPLFGNLSEPLVKVETRLNGKTRQRFWCWKTLNFFWFWNEDEPDFFGVFLEGEPKSLMNNPWANKWFEEANRTTHSNELGKILRQQLHNRNWARAITLCDPRIGKEGVWRILWRRRDFLLQNAFSGQAVRFFPETNWEKDSRHWNQLNPLSNSTSFFAELFWPLLTERRGRLETAFEFLDLPLDTQKQPIRFRVGGKEEFETIMRAGLVLDYSSLVSESRVLAIRFESRNSKPILQINYGWAEDKVSPRLSRLEMTFAPYLTDGFGFHSVATSPLVLQGRSNTPVIYVRVQGPFTAHEQIDAMVTMREWVSRNAPKLLVDWQ